MNFMPSNDTDPQKKDTPMTNPKPETTIKVEEIGNGLFIKWNIAIT